MQHISNNNGVVQLAHLNGNISFNSVFFSYPTRPTAPVLNGVSLNIPAGSVVAVCGPSGSGKSTLASLILGFYSPNRKTSIGDAAFGEGSISVDNVPLEVIDMQWLRRHIGFVPQEPVLFDATLRDNIAMGFPSASEAQIIAAAKTAQVLFTSGQLASSAYQHYSANHTHRN